MMILKSSLLLLTTLSTDVHVSAFQTPHSARVLRSKASVACAYCAQQKRRLLFHGNNEFQLRSSKSGNDANSSTDKIEDGHEDVNGTHNAAKSQSSSEIKMGVLKEVPNEPRNFSSLLPKNLLENMKNMFSSIFNKKFGKRGEIYVMGQVLLMYSIAIGHIPLLKNFVQAVFGPMLFCIGAAVMIHSIREMGSAFTALATPVNRQKGGRLVVSGLYEYVRHPIYAGNIACLMSISIMTGNAMRLLLTAAYWMLVEMKTRKEEIEMVDKFGLEYNEYCKRVPHKFFPFTFTAWNREQEEKEVTHKWKLLDEPKQSSGSSSSNKSASVSKPAAPSKKDDKGDDNVKGKSSHSNLFP